jgi:O-antigen ligase
MELILLKLVALARPLISMRFGEEFFAIFGIGLFAILAGAVLMRAATQKSLRLSPIDGLILAFTTWCIARAVIYIDASYISQLAKLLVPLLSYIVVKNVVPDREEYRRMIFWIIVGLSVPTLLSAGMIAIGSPEAVDKVKYQTGLTRWQGVYTNPHNFGHSMTLLLMTSVLYVSLWGRHEGKRHGVSPRVENVLLGFLGATALYCLYRSEVRTAVLGLLIFLGLYGYMQNKKALLLGGTALAVVAVLAAPYWIPHLLHEFDPDRRGGEPTVMEMGSGRPTRWANDIKMYATLPIDQEIAGIGVGVRSTSEDETVGGHSDWLRILWDTGMVGFVLFAWLQILILRAILRMRGRERHVFLALFVAVNVMNAISNSYIARIQVGQLYCMILAFIEIPPHRAQAERVPVRATDRTA